MKSFLATVGLSFCLAAFTGCAADVGEGAGEEESAVDETISSADALTSIVEDGSTAKTTANLRLRDAPSTTAATLRTLSSGTTVTILDGTPQNGFYRVDASGTEGYCHGNYLRLGSSEGAGGGSAPGDATGDTFRSDGSGYYPDSSAMEGGYVDRRGAQLRTLQQFLAGTAEYVSVAMDSTAFPYGQKLRIRELEQKYGRTIEFRVVDTGGAFRGKGRTKIDICVANRTASYEATLNGMLTITVD